MNDPYFSQISILVRKWEGPPNPKLKVIPVNFENKDELNKKLGSGETIFCCIGTTQKKVKGDTLAYRRIDHDIPVSIGHLGLEKGFHKFVLVSAVGADSKASNFYLQLKGTVERDIIAIPYKAHHIFRPSILLGNRKEKRIGEKIGMIISVAMSFILRGPLSKYRAIKAEEVARAMLEAAKSNSTGVTIFHYDEIKSLQRISQAPEIVKE